MMDQIVDMTLAHLHWRWFSQTHWGNRRALPCVSPLWSMIIPGIIADVRLARRFGKGGGFAVGLILSSFVFPGILAFDESTCNHGLA